jgi:hypothetical protein
VVADANGCYRLGGLTAGRHTRLIAAPAYGAIERIVTVGDEAPAIMDVDSTLGGDGPLAENTRVVSVRARPWVAWSRRGYHARGIVIVRPSMRSTLSVS